MTRRLILGTAGHIDHGKTALVGALTGVDTDRLAEEKARGITIDLGFAELAEGDIRFGVVDVPGHDGFVRNMLAGATGMDVAVMVVAADEGVMPQTREHLAILDLLEVRRLVVALTKSDAAEDAWIDLVEEEVRETLAPTRFSDAPIVRTSAEEGTGLRELRAELVQAGRAVDRDADDILLLPVDRVFTVRGTGTVVTGTLVSGRIGVGDTVRVAPGTLEARVRGLQTHGVDAPVAEAGARVAVAVTGTGVDPEAITRGHALLSNPRWEPSRMLTVRIRVLADTGWSIETGQRVRVHAGTAEIMARCTVLADLDGAPGDHLRPGDSGWVQLRLEGEIVARVGMRLVVRAYSPVTTIAGGTIAEIHPPRRRGRNARDVSMRLADRVGPDPEVRVLAALEVRGPEGLHPDELPIRTGVAPGRVAAALQSARLAGVARAPDGTVFAPTAVRDFGARVVDDVQAIHEVEAFRPGLDVAKVRGTAPRGAHPSFADAVLAHEVAGGRLEVEAGAVLRPGFEPTLTDDQVELKARLAALYAEAGFEAPALTDLPADLRADPAFHTLLDMLEREGAIVALDEAIRIDAATLQRGVERIREEFAGREGLGPTDFRTLIPVSRRYLLPILEHLDRVGVTRFEGNSRRVEEG